MAVVKTTCLAIDRSVFHKVFGVDCGVDILFKNILRQSLQSDGTFGKLSCAQISTIVSFLQTIRTSFEFSLMGRLSLISLHMLRYSQKMLIKEVFGSLLCLTVH